ncbi:putative F-box/LRR-repeat protein [Trifolium repens]|nr:putative F-box/LRR-repeat protein [Trifolium repens]
MPLFSFPAKEMERVIPNWLELPRDITVNILQRLSTVDIVTSACLACPLWWNICKDPFMWRTIQIIIKLNNNSHSGLLKICRYAIERSCGCLPIIL